MLRATAFASLLVLTLLSACAAPLQNGGVEVMPGAEARLETLCRFRGGAGRSVCVQPEGPSRQ
jgi:hypothetical protein